MRGVDLSAAVALAALCACVHPHPPGPGPTPTPTPGPSPTPLACGEFDDSNLISADRPTVLYPEYEKVLDLVGDRCGYADATEAPQQETLRLVAAGFRTLGRCAWYVEGGDAVTVLADDELYEQWHAVFYRNGCTIRSVGAFKHSWKLPPPAPQLHPISVVGNRFFRDGEPFAFKLLSNCCDDPRTPDIDEGSSTGTFLPHDDQIAKYASAPEDVRRNAIEMRLGPSHRDPSWPPLPEGWEMMDYALGRCAAYNAAGFYCYLIVNDAWTLASRPDLSLWGEDCSVMQGAPPDHWIQWTTTLATKARDQHLAVVYSLDNEGFRCRPNQAWEDGLYNAIKAVDPSAVVGSSHALPKELPNQGRRYYDFISVQDTFQNPPEQPVPVVMVETEGLFHPEAHYRYAEAHSAPGVYWGRWRGISSMSEWYYMVGAGPDPGPVCADAPAIGKMGFKRQSNYVGDATPLACDWPWCQENGSPGRTCCPYVPEGGTGAPGVPDQRPIEMIDSGWFSGYKLPSGLVRFAKAGRLPRSSEFDFFRRISCEEENGWPFSWSLDGQACPEIPGPTTPCWKTANPLQVGVEGGHDGQTMRVCAKNDVCREITW
jgi:hypothetical protein